MAGLNALHDQLLNDGQITRSELEVIKAHICGDNQLDYEDAKFLVGLMKEADAVCPEFDDLLFRCLRGVILADGEVTMDEQYLLLQLLYSDGDVRECERKFISELYRDVTKMTPEFKSLCETALATSGGQWELGGK